LSKKALRALGVGVGGDLDDEVKRKRRAVMERAFRDAKPYSPEVQRTCFPASDRTQKLRTISNSRSWYLERNCKRFSAR
jgi:hypothetical protein